MRLLLVEEEQNADTNLRMDSFGKINSETVLHAKNWCHQVASHKHAKLTEKILKFAKMHAKKMNNLYNCKMDERQIQVFNNNNNNNNHNNNK